MRSLTLALCAIVLSSTVACGAKHAASEATASPTPAPQVCVGQRTAPVAVGETCLLVDNGTVYETEAGAISSDTNASIWILTYGDCVAASITGGIVACKVVPDSDHHSLPMAAGVGLPGDGVLREGYTVYFKD